MVNVNRETGVRFGVVNLHSLADWVSDEFFHNGKNVTAQALFEEWEFDHPNASDEDVIEFWEGYYENEDTYSLETEDGLSLELTYLGGAPLVFVLESPVKERAALCSPCVPNAGDLDNRREDGVECYSLPAEWWREK